MAQWKQQDYAESARWEQQQAYQRYRQGEREEAQPVKSELDSAAYQLGLILSPNFTAQEADVIVCFSIGPADGWPECISTGIRDGESHKRQSNVLWRIG